MLEWVLPIGKDKLNHDRDGVCNVMDHCSALETHAHTHTRTHTHTHTHTHTA